MGRGAWGGGGNLRCCSCLLSEADECVVVSGGDVDRAEREKGEGVDAWPHQHLGACMALTIQRQGHKHKIATLLDTSP